MWLFVFMWRFVVQSLSCVWLSDPKDCCTPHFPVLYHVPELAQSHVHWVGDAIQPSHPLLSPLFLPSMFPSIRVFSKSRLFASGGQSVGASASASVLPKSIHGWFPLGLTGLISLLSWDSQEYSPTPQFQGINSSVLSLLYGPTLRSIRDYWKKHIFDYSDLCWHCLCFLICCLGLS